MIVAGVALLALEVVGDLLARPASTWRSRQLYETFSWPPTNHFAKGRFHSSTVSKGLYQLTYFFACSAQNALGVGLGGFEEALSR